MADKFTPPTMDWTSTGDVHKRFKLFRQKCEFIFDGPLEGVDEKKQVRHLLLWVGDKGLEIYNTTTWTAPDDRDKKLPVLNALENYTKPQSNQILARYQLRCLKQGDLPLEEFVTKARLLVDDSGYPAAVKDETLRDTLVFGLKSDKVRRDAIAKGNDLTFQQVYELAKVDESTRAQMKAITQHEDTSELHTVRSKKKSPFFKKPQENEKNTDFKGDQKPFKKPFKFKSKGCFRCGGNHDKSTQCPAKFAKCKFCGKQGHYIKMCLKRNHQRVHQIVTSPGYNGQDIYLGEDNTTDDSGETPNVFLGTLHSKKPGTIHSVSRYAKRIYAVVTLNDQHKMKLKIDTGADICAINTDDLQDFPFPIDIKQDNSLLEGYGPGTIKNIGVTNLKLTFRDKSINTSFNIVHAPGKPSVIGCAQAQQLGIITVNIDDIQSKSSKQDKPADHVKYNDSNPAKVAAAQGKLTKELVLKQYSDCFDKIGRFPGDKYHIELIDNPVPVVHPPRTVPVHILPLYKAELDKMIQEEIIVQVTEPTEWVNSIVCHVTDKPDGTKKVRLCLDPKDLNKNIRREHYYSKTIDEILPLLHGSTKISAGDTTKGYYHVELDYESSLLCTFNTPFGRFRPTRLPFGVKIAQDIFQRRLDEILKDIPNVAGIADDILVFGSSDVEHDQAFINMLETCRKNNVGLNSEKLQFKQEEVKFYGHTLTEKGLHPAKDKLQAIKNIKVPANAAELQTILGMVNYLNRFSVKLAEYTAPLRELTKKHVHFRWEQHHQAALDKIKKELSSSRIISYYDSNPTTPTILQCDASQVGLGAWLRQGNNGTEKIVAMASRALTDTERRYSNIERECLAVVFGLEKFEYYLYGREVIVETDHSPLEQIFKKNIAEAPARLQRLLLRCLKFDITVKYRPGKSVPVADALSRVCLEKVEPVKQEVHFITTKSCPININAIQEATLQDQDLNKLKEVIFKGWPTYRKQCPQELWDYWTFRCDLVIEDGLILKGDRIIIPQVLRGQVLEALHTGHQGETKCLLLARESVFWPGITNDIKQLVKDCDICNKYQVEQPKLPLMQPDLPTRPWEKLGTDIFEFKGLKYLMIVDYYSRFPVIRLLSDMSADTICNHFTSVLAEYGLPSIIIADFGTQYISQKFKDNCTRNGITLTFSSPYHHQANSLAERAVGTCKSLWKKAVEGSNCPYTALWMYRVTPLDSNIPSPYELLFGRKPRTLMPSSKKALQSKHADNESHQEKNIERQQRQAEVYDKKASIDKRILNNMEPVYVRNTIKKVWEPGVILNRPNPIREPRTYIVDINGKVYYRTREHLKPRSNDVPREVNEHLETPILPFTPTPSTSADIPSASTTKPTIPVEAEIPKSPPQPPTPVKVKSPVKETASYKPTSYTTRSGRTTQVPAKFKD